MRSSMNCVLRVGAVALVLHAVPSVHAKNRPVSKVITLLKDMLQQLDNEAKSDEEIYDKMACWCETNDKEKTAAIADAQARISDLTTKIEEGTAMVARLDIEIKNLEKEIAKNQASLDQATALRQKELTAFNSEEKDLLESISALKAAITVLSKHHTGALLQDSRSELLDKALATKIRNGLLRHAKLFKGVLSPAERKAVDAFLQAPEDYFDSSPTFRQSYNPQSGQIFGILRQMKETFEVNLSDAQKEELANQKSYQELKTAKEAEITAAQTQMDTKTETLASSNMKLALAKEDIVDTRASLSADEQFLMSLKEKCQMTDSEWETRQKTRNEEIAAISKALSILSGDESHDLFTRTFNPAFIQTESLAHSQSKERAQAAQLLSAAGRKLKSPQLVSLASRVKLDTFERVKKIIDDMIAQLLKQKADEIKHRDFCVDELNANQLQTEKKIREQQDEQAKISDLEMSIEQLTKAITTLQAEIAEMQVQMKRAGEDREKQNSEFQSVVADQRETQKLLKQALTVLKQYYHQSKASLLMEKQDPAGPPPPPGFQTYEKSAAAGGVVGLLEQIISDAAAMEAETVRAEQEAQKAYEEFVKDTNAATKAKGEDIVNKSKAKATAEGDLVLAKEAEEAVRLELEQLSNYNAQLHQSCDFIVKNFDLRQTSRDEEVDALRQAKAILSGAKFEEFIQA